MRTRLLSAIVTFAAAGMIVPSGAGAAPPLLEPIDVSVTNVVPVTGQNGGPVEVVDQPDPSSFVLFNDRITPDEGSILFEVPDGDTLVITDIVVQNRAPGDNPVDESYFSRLVMGVFRKNEGDMTPGRDLTFTVVGNDTLNLHFETGMVVPAAFRVLNITNSTAPFVEFTITGFLSHE